MRNKFILLLLLISLFISCENSIQEEEEEVDLTKIISPNNEWNYYENRTLQLSLNIRSNEIEWFSDLDGFLGNGNGLFVSLRKGFHNIKANYKNKTYSIGIEIKKDNVGYLEERRFLISLTDMQINITEGLWFPSVTTHDGTMIGFSYGYPEPKPIFSILADNTACSPLRDFHIPIENIENLKVKSSKARFSITASYKVGDYKDFLVLNTANTYEKPNEINGRMIHSGNRYTLWRDVNESISSSLINQIINNIDNKIMPRLISIWGEWADVDGDGKIAILLTKTINNENVSTGFFFPQDMFTVESDPNEPSYNPDSNQMDIVYVGYPIANDPVYNINTISAAIAHEITHAITFSQKTYNKLIAGNSSIKRETVFLEEGWSHLSENLCGFSVSGGNIVFLKRYFENTAIYSFCSPNAMGQMDSAGMRGAMTLFLSWLFWKQGGMEWHPTDSGVVYDRGGINFLKTLTSSDSIGWPSIGETAGKTMDDLFLEFVSAMNRQRVSNKLYEYKSDPYTGEPVEFFNNMGEFLYQGVLYNISIDTMVSANEPRNTLPWSFFFLESVSAKDNYLLPVSSRLILGKALISFIKGNL